MNITLVRTPRAEFRGGMNITIVEAVTAQNAIVILTTIDETANTLANQGNANSEVSISSASIPIDWSAEIAQAYKEYRWDYKHYPEDVELIYSATVSFI